MATLGEVLRRLYHDLVAGRARVRVIPAGSPEPEFPPIFLTGLYRSGTTVLRYVVDSHSRICCPPESNFIPFLAPLADDPYCRAGLGPMGFDPDHVRTRLREFCLYFFGNYARSVGKPRWADKTPRYVDCLDFLVELFPESRFVMIHRHGLDQSNSLALAAMGKGGPPMREALQPYQRRGEDARLSAVRHWCDKTAQILDFERDHASQCVHIRYEDLCKDPETQLKLVFNFLEEPWEPEVLQFYEFPHDMGSEDGRALVARGFIASTGNYQKWPRKLLQEALKMAVPALQRLGY